MVRAFEYTDVVKEDRTEQGSPVLLRGPFLDEVLVSFGLKEAKMSEHLLLCVRGEVALSYAETVSRALSCVRDSDIAGNIDGDLYLLMAQAGEPDLPIISGRFERAGLTIELVTADEEYALVCERKAELSAGHDLVLLDRGGRNS